MAQYDTDVPLVGDYELVEACAFVVCYQFQCSGCAVFCPMQRLKQCHVSIMA
jgi:hypothetical protein